MPKRANRVAYLGPPGSFTHEAMIARFPGCEEVEKNTLEDVFDSVYVEEADYAVLPVENSTEGIIALTYHKLVEQGLTPELQIQGEIYHTIAHNLGTIRDTPLDSIEYVHTKEQAWDQCRLWVSRNLRQGVVFVPEASTSRGARNVAEKGEVNRAAIASGLALQLHCLKPIAKGIQDFRSNATRFFIVGRRPLRKSAGKADYKMTMGMVLLDRIGAISDAFRVFADTGVDVRSVKVSPVRAPSVVNWKDWFFVDVFARDGDLGNVVQAIEQLRNKEALILTVRVLGQYPSSYPEEFPKRRAEPPTVPVDLGAGGLSLEDIIAAGERANTEFKSTLRWNLKENRKDDEVEFAVLKAIVGFMNARGGVLLIGVEDDGTIHGLQEDYGTLRKQSKDGFELHLRNIVQESVGGPLSHLVSTRFASKDDKDVCIVTVQPSPSPVWLKRGGRNEFYVRSGNQTKPFDSKETAEWVKLRWG